MDKEKKRKFHLMLYGIAIPVSLFALYTFVFVFDNGIGVENFVNYYWLGLAYIRCLRVYRKFEEIDKAKVVRLIQKSGSISN